MSDVNPGSPVHKGSIERLSETACYNTNSMRREHNYQSYNPGFLQSLSETTPSLAFEDIPILSPHYPFRGLLCRFFGPTRSLYRISDVINRILRQCRADVGDSQRSPTALGQVLGERRLL